MSKIVLEAASRIPIKESATEIVPALAATLKPRDGHETPDGDATLAVRPIGPSNGAGRGVSSLQRIVGYEILEELGRGGMGVVYKAWQHSLQRTVALKMILAGSFAAKEDLDRFRAEAMAIARLHHPNLLSIYEIGETYSLPFYAMEYMEGGSLARRLNGQPIAPRVAAGLVRSLAQAMDYAHKNGIVHRDLKPANILLSGNEAIPLDECIAKITDFGIAKHLHSSSSCTRTGDILGTPHYMAPEQATGRSGEVGPTADVYSLGAILYELLTGRTPFHGHDGAAVLLLSTREDPEPPTHWVRGLPTDLATIVMKCLEKEPGKRYASAAALAEDLARFLKSEPIHARPVSSLDRAWKWTRRRPALAALSLMTVLMVLLGFGMMALMWRQAVSHADRQDELLTQSKMLLSDAYLDRGIHLAEKGDVRRGVHWMMRSLEVADEIERRQQRDNPLTPVIRMNLASWGQCVYPRELTLTHENWVWDVAFTPDGRHAATASRDMRVQLWHAITGQPVGPALEHRHPVWGLAFHPDGKTLFTIAGDAESPSGELRVWTVDADRPGHYVPRGPIISFPHDLFRLQMNQQGDRLWVASSEGAAHVFAFDARDGGNGLRRTAEPLPGLHALAVFSPDGKTLASIKGQMLEKGLVHTAQVQLWDARTGTPLGESLEHPGTVRTLVFTRDGRHLIASSATEKSQVHGEASVVQVWNVADRKVVATTPPLAGRIKASAVSPDGHLFAASLFDHSGAREPGSRLQITDGHVELFQIAPEGKLQPIGRPLRTQHVVWHMEFSPDSRMLLAGCENYGAFLWSVPNGQRLVPTIWHEGNCVKVAFSKDGRTAITASAGGSRHAAARLWEVPGFSHIGPTMTQPGNCRAVYWENDGSHAWVSSGMHHCRWDPFRGVKLREVPLPEYAHWVYPTRDDGRIFVEFPHGKVREFDLAKGEAHKLPYDFESQRGAGFAFDPRRELLLEYWTKPFRFQLRDLTGRAVGKPGGTANHEMITTTFSPNGDSLAVSLTILTEDNHLVLYNARDGSVLHDLPVKQPVKALAFSADGKTLAFGGIDCQMQRLDVKSGQTIGSPLLHESFVSWAAFIDNDRLLATSSGKGHVQIWDVKTGKRVGPAFEHHADVAAYAVHPQAKHLLTATNLSQARLWRLPEPVDGPLERIRLWVETITGMEMTEHDTIVPLEMDRVMQKRDRLKSMGGAPSPHQR